MRFIDSHGHLYREYYEADLEEVVARSIEAQVTKIILPCVSSLSIHDIFESAASHPQNLFPMVGLHPTDVPDDYERELEVLESWLDHDGVVGIGEIGMDLYHDDEKVEQQKIAFERQLRWAVERKLPVSLHIRSAYAEAMSILRQFEGTPLTGILHCFSGGIQEAEWAIRHGFLLGIGGVVTFKNNKLQDIVKEVGLAHIALETDCPFLAPTPYRGTRNESAYIPIIAQKVADIFECPIEQVAEATTTNVERIFPLNNLRQLKQQIL